MKRLSTAPPSRTNLLLALIALTTLSLKAEGGQNSQPRSVPCGSSAQPAPRPVALENVVSLFNGRDLAGWDLVGKQAAQDWKVEAGCLVCSGKGHTWLRSQRQHKDFNLRLEYQLSSGANSGVYVRVGA